MADLNRDLLFSTPIQTLTNKAKEVIIAASV